MNTDLLMPPPFLQVEGRAKNVTLAHVHVYNYKNNATVKIKVQGTKCKGQGTKCKDQGAKCNG